MKDKFFKLLCRLYIRIYRYVMRQVYIHIDRDRAKGCARLKSDDERRIYHYWNRYGLKPKLDDYRLYADRGLRPDPGLISTEIWTSVIEPNHNVLEFSGAFSDKNYFDLILGRENTPNTVLRCITGKLLDVDYTPISIDEIETVIDSQKDYILKPSIDSGGGRDVSKVHGADLNAENIKKARDIFEGNFCIQEVFQQHDFLKSFNPTSVQSIRVVSTYIQDHVEIICATMRMGRPGSVVDNFVNGGYAVSVDVESGMIGDIFADHDMKTYTASDLEICGVGKRIPFWEDAKKLVCKLHPRLAHFGIISWDVTIDKAGSPIIIEYNLFDSLIDWHQIFIGPVLGDKQEEMLPKLLKKNPYI